ncbi:hypothetical protein C4D60_Mb04t34920 [Musa balbisiana]|uniref:Uncharacterized protein n=1 Tax=Musa balbisiana TaxID=52838 RepID=A0A4S8KH16_MUSBA|nr:hypothetical protein C4D60_Mb04t34920 [Musa balbisiana]
MPTPLTKRENRNYDWFVYHGRRFLEVKGIMINTFAELERGRSKPSRKASVPPGRPVRPLYPIRPILALQEDTSRTGGEKHPCIRWLDGQPPASMVFLCFGSMGSFGVAQVREIAVGLERRGRRFLWCLR